MYLFHDRFLIYGYGFQQFFAFSGFMGIVFCKNSFISELFWHFRIYGYDSQKILQIYGYTFEKFLQIYGWYFYDLNGTLPYHENSSNPPPPGIPSSAIRNVSYEHFQKWAAQEEKFIFLISNTAHAQGTSRLCLNRYSLRGLCPNISLESEG